MKSKVMIDSNVFLYFLLGTFPDQTCRQKIVTLFKSIERREIEGVTTSRIVDEVIFKLLLAKTRETYPNKPLEHLKKETELARRLHTVPGDLFDFLDAFGIEIYPVTVQHLRHSGTLLKAFGLFGNDALILEVMLSHNLTRLATCDGDFDRIDLIERY